ncbi:LiaF transmembrane domain-containing protein [Adhaeribacter terreus]|uniref:LiaI-LiaF-like domain-containing protein n=1 Tax=Adhaeribacter terreus TaxID=529703 RepID=A0ABW0EF73_9BACT
MQHNQNYRPRRSGKVMAGLILLAVGVIFLLNNMGYFFPNWLFSWPMLLIVLGLFVGFKHNFRTPGGFILILVGATFLAKKYFYINIAWGYVWPVIIIIVGLWMIFGRSHRYHFQRREDLEKDAENAASSNATFTNQEPTNPNLESHFENPNPYDNISASEDDFLDSTSVFGGTKKLVLSKNFKGGEIVTIMGGAEINLSQADIQGRAILDVTQIMGGTKIVVPSNWDVKSEMAAILGGIDDKRIIQPGGVNPNKVLIIKGTSILGGIDIRSF